MNDEDRIDKLLDYEKRRENCLKVVQGLSAERMYQKWCDAQEHLMYYEKRIAELEAENERLKSLMCEGRPATALIREGMERAVDILKSLDDWSR